MSKQPAFSGQLSAFKAILSQSSYSFAANFALDETRPTIIRHWGRQFIAGILRAQWGLRYRHKNFAGMNTCTV